MGEEFAHLHVASGFSMRYGTSTPEAIVERAAQHGQPAVALTDRDGLYGAVRFVRAATAAGVAPVLGVDVAMECDAAGRRHQPPRAGRTPVRGGASVDPRHPRVTLLARGEHGGVGRGQGWAALCHLVTDTHLRGERGRPVSSPDLVAVHGATGSLTVLLGPDSDVGRALLARRRDAARALLAAWRARLPVGAVAIEVVCHGGPDGTPGSRSHAAALLGLADEAGIPAVLTAAVRHVDRGDARVADVLDAARRLVVLDTRHLDRVTDAGHLASTVTMRQVAVEVVRRAGAGPTGGATGERDRVERLLRDTVALARACTQHARRDLGIGEVHLPEPEVLGIAPGVDPQQVLTARCRDAVLTRYPGVREGHRERIHARLGEELGVVAELGYPTYFLTVAAVVDLIRGMGARVAARGSGAGSLVTYLLGISGVDPIRHGLLMERFCSPLRAELPDIDIDVESARRTEIYEHVLDRFGGDRVTCVSMMDTYKVRHAVRDVGAALGLPPVEVDEIAKAFPHIRARDARNAITDLPELRAKGLDTPRLRTLFELVERLDGLPRHVALHPCGVVLSGAALLDRTPVEASWLGFPMSQFDKDDVEALGLLKLDILGIRMQSAMAHAVQEVARAEGVRLDLDDTDQVPFDDEATFRMIRTTHTLGCFQIESPGQRELIGKFGPERFEDLVIDISLFRPGPVKSDMIRPFLEARHGWSAPEHLHPSLVPILAETEGVVVFHEQMLRIIAETTGVSLAQSDEVRRAMGSPQGQTEIEAWWRPAAAARGYSPSDRDRIWEVLRAFASFGFCKAHAAAFALPTYQSAWLKTHHPAAFLAGVLTHDPGMYPKRLILDDARTLGITVLGLDVNASGDTYQVEQVPAAGPPPSHPDLPDGRGQGIRVSLSEVKGITAAEVSRIIDGQPYDSVADVWNRARVSRPVLERMVLAGAFDSIYGIGAFSVLGRRGRVTRRDILLHVSELERWDRARSVRQPVAPRSSGSSVRSSMAQTTTPQTMTPQTMTPQTMTPGAGAGADVRSRAAAQSRAAQPVRAEAAQLTLDLGDAPELTTGSGLPELTGTDRVRAELDVLGLDVSSHVLDVYTPMLDALGVARSADLLATRSGSTVLAAGVKVATQTPPIRSGRRVVFLTLDDSTGPVDATFFEDVQGPYAATVFHSWLMLVRGVTRRTGARGISLRATGAWELSRLWSAWTWGGVEEVLAVIAADDLAVEALAVGADDTPGRSETARGRRVLVHASGFRQSPYADVRPAGGDVRGVRALASDDRLPQPGNPAPPRKLWHSSPGSSGH